MTQTCERRGYSTTRSCKTRCIAIKIVRKGKVPVVLRRTPFLTSMVAKWDLNYLVRARAAPCARAPPLAAR